MEWSRVSGGTPELRASTRSLGEEPDRWRAGLAKATHPGPESRRNTKFVGVDVWELARAQVAESPVEEVLLFDRDGWLVEGGHSNFLLVTESGELATPDLALGGVEGLGLTIVRESRPEIRFARLGRDDVFAARELMSTNGVRGVVPIVALEGRPIGDGGPGPWSRRLRRIFFRD